LRPSPASVGEEQLSLAGAVSAHASQNVPVQKNPSEQSSSVVQPPHVPLTHGLLAQSKSLLQVSPSAQRSAQFAPQTLEVPLEVQHVKLESQEFKQSAFELQNWPSLQPEQSVPPQSTSVSLPS